MDFQRYEHVCDIVSRHDVAKYPLVFAFIAEWANVDYDIAVKAFYDNHCDIVNACIHLEICMNRGRAAVAAAAANTAAAAAAAILALAGPKSKPKSKSKPNKCLAKLKRLFCCCASTTTDTDNNDEYANDSDSSVWCVSNID